MAPALRRLPRALVVAGLTALVLGGLVGAQADDGAPAEESLTFGQPAIGDRWTYQILAEGPWHFGAADGMRAGTPYPYAEFEWIDPIVIRDEDGAERAVDRVHAKRLEYNGDIDYAENHEDHHWIPDEERHLFAAGLPDPVATESPVTSREGGQASQVAFLQTDNGVPVVEGWSRWYGENHAPCLARSPLQGTTVDLGEPLPIFVDCLPHFDQPDDDLGSDGMWSYNTMTGLGPFEYAATESLLGHRAHRFDSADGSSVWFASGVPVPLQVRGQLGLEVATVTLSSYESGSTLLGEAFPAPEPGMAPPVGFAPRRPWGPDDSGVDHPFPASEAFQGAMADPTFSYLRDYLRANPDGATYILEYSEDLESMPQERSWFFALTAHGSTAAFQATQSSYGPLPAPPTVEYQEMGFMTLWLAFWAPDVDHLPAEVPTAASVTARWQAYEATEGRTDEPNGWGMGVTCAFDCSYGLIGSVVAGKDPVAMLKMGYSSVQSPGGLPQLQDRTFTGSQLDVHLEDGATKSLTQWTGYDEGLQINPLGGQSPVDPTTEPAPPKGGPRRALATLVPTPEQGAAIGAAASVAGLLYWLWPSLKGGFAGLFSRVTGPQLLEHPARARLVQLVQAEPGIHFQDLVRRSGLPNGTAVHHLHKLTQAGLLAARPLGRYTCYFPGSSPDRATLAAAPVTRSDGARRILAEVVANPGVTGSELALRLGLQGSTVAYHVKRMEEAGLLSATRDGRQVRLRAVAA